MRHDPLVNGLITHLLNVNDAELAWKAVTWALGRDEAKVRDAVLSAFHATVEELLSMPIVDYGVDLEVWHAHGRVTCAEARELARAGVEQVLWPCLHALLSAPDMGHRVDRKASNSLRRARFSASIR